MAVTILREFDTASQHTYSASELELLSGQAVVKSAVVSTEVMYANYSEAGRLNSTRGSKDIVFSGTANTGEVAGGVLNFPNADASIGTYSNITEVVDDFSYSVLVRMNQGTVTSDRTVLEIVSNIDSGKHVWIVSNAGGSNSTIKFRGYNAAGALTHDLALTTVDLSANPTFEIGLWNDNSGNMKCLLGGVPQASPASLDSVFTDFNIILGNTVKVVCDYDNLRVWNAVIALDTSSPQGEALTYGQLENIMMTPIPGTVDSIVSLIIAELINSGAELKHFISIDSKYFYWDGSAWSTSVGSLATANSSTDFVANISTVSLVANVGANVSIGHVFKSTDGYTTPYLEYFSILVGQTSTTTALTLCTVSGVVKDLNGVPVSGAVIRVNSTDRHEGNTFLGPSAKTTSDAKGEFEMTIPETATAGTTVDFDIEYQENVFNKGTDKQVWVVFPYNTKIIPNAASADFGTLATGT